MNRYSIMCYHIVIISTILIATIADPTSNVYEKSNKYFGTYKNELNNIGNIPEEYFDIDKRPKNLYSWMSNEAIRSPTRDIVMISDKPAPLDPYSWQYTVKRKNRIISRNPYSWMNDRYNRRY